MHERTQRLLCQLAFLVACALPTVVTIGTIAVRSTPWFANWQRETLESQLADRFGLDFHIEQFSVLAPNAIELQNVQVCDPETKSEIARVRLVQWVKKNGKIGIRLAQPNLNSEHLPGAWGLLHDRFLCRPDLANCPVRLSADDLSIRSTQGGITLTEFKAEMQPHDYANETVAQFKIAGQEMQFPASVSITRDRSRSEPETAWKLNTGGSPLPCYILADYLPWIQNFGNTANFNGLINWRHRRTGWQIDLGQSEFSGIEVSRLFDSLSHKLTGRANVWFAECRIEEGLIADIMGTVNIEKGQIGAPLIYSSSALGMRPTAPVTSPSLPFELMRFNFVFDETGWQFSGACDNVAQGLPPGVLAIGPTSQPLVFLATPDRIPASLPKKLIAPEYAFPLFQSDRQNNLLDLLPKTQVQQATGSLQRVPRLSMRPSE